VGHLLMTTTTTGITTPAPAYGPATDIAGGENASPAAAGPPAPYATHPKPTKKETIPMTDQTIPADPVRKIADAMDASMRRCDEYPLGEFLGSAVREHIRALRALLPPPP